MKSEKVNKYDIQIKINEYINKIITEQDCSKLEKIILEIKSYIYENDILRIECDNRLKKFENNLYTQKHFSILDSVCKNINSFIKKKLGQNNIGIELSDIKDPNKCDNCFLIKTFFESVDKTKSYKLYISKNAPWLFICYYIAEGLLISRYKPTYKLQNDKFSLCIDAYKKFIFDITNDDYDVDIYLFNEKVNSNSDVPYDYAVYIIAASTVILLTKLIKYLENCIIDAPEAVEQKRDKKDLLNQNIFNFNLNLFTKTNVIIDNKTVSDVSSDKSNPNTTDLQNMQNKLPDKILDENIYLKVKEYIDKYRLTEEEFMILQLRKTLSPNKYKNIAESLPQKISENGIKQKFLNIKNKLSVDSPEEAIHKLEQEINCKIDELDINKIFDN